MRPVSLAAAAAVVLLAAGLAACDSSGTDGVPLPAPSQPGGSTGIVPLAVGNEWVFETRLTRYTQTGSPTEDLPTRDTLRVVDTRVQNGETWYRLVATPSPQAASAVLEACYGGWLTNRSDGLYRLSSTDSTRAARLVRYPVATGDIYAVVPPFVVTNPTGWHGERRVAVKRTDHPVEVGQLSTTGPLYTSTLERLRTGDQFFSFAPDTPPLHDVFGEGVGFAHLEGGFVSLRAGTYATLDARYQFRLVEAKIAGA